MRLLVPVALLALAACAERSDGATDAAASGAAPAVFWLYGTPGPWFRVGSTQIDFDLASRECREASVEARDASPADERNARAYEAFLDCMTGRRWSRGVPPQDVGGPEGPG